MISETSEMVTKALMSAFLMMRLSWFTSTRVMTQYSTVLPLPETSPSAEMKVQVLPSY